MFLQECKPQNYDFLLNPTRKKQNTSMKIKQVDGLTKFKYSNFYTRFKCNKKVVGGKMKLID